MSRLKPRDSVDVAPATPSKTLKDKDIIAMFLACGIYENIGK